MFPPAIVKGEYLKRFILDPGVVLDYGGLIDRMDPEDALQEVVSRINNGFSRAVSKLYRTGEISQDAADQLLSTWIDPFAEGGR